jgi:flagellar biosynthesis protein FlhA
MAFAPEIEEHLTQGLTDDGKTLAPNPVFTQSVLGALNKELEQVVSRTGLQPVILCNARIRLPLRRMLERMLPQIAILSYNEVGPSVKVNSLGLVRLEGSKAIPG